MYERYEENDARVNVEQSVEALCKHAGAARVLALAQERFLADVEDHYEESHIGALTEEVLRLAEEAKIRGDQVMGLGRQVSEMMDEIARLRTLLSGKA
ncbi:hypothetical protein GCM10023116_48450 [Kistimonas scapharcae]|uniref:Uncharacterized protein n=1 Tax=Kistimonas scapharcae TaxID=1036133 RepID=A0ABP8VA21_9GAMM